VKALRAIALASFSGALLCACIVTPDLNGGIAVGPPAAGGAPAPGGGPIEAGCSYNATQLPPSADGAVFQVACPPGCESTGGLWGTDVYTADSAICKAGIHAGAISPGGGVVSVQLQPGRPAYRGSPRYGIASNDYGAYNRSYAVMTNAAPPAAAAPAAPQTIEAGCSFNSTQIVGAPGTYAVVSCPAGCAQTGGLWGTDIYTGDSAICKAAVHAGIISDAGGPVGVLLDAGQPAYRGTARNGVRSNDYGAYHSSFRLQRP
jgi:LCCL domain